MNWDDFHRHRAEVGNILVWPDEYVVRFTARWPAPLRVLDLQCGAGRHSRLLAAAGHDVTAMDLSSVALAQIDEDITTIQGDAREIPFPDNHFGGLVAWRSLHVHSRLDIDRVTAEIARVVAPGGPILLSTRTANNVYGQRLMAQPTELRLVDIYETCGVFGDVHVELTKSTMDDRRLVDSYWVVSAVSPRKKRLL